MLLLLVVIALTNKVSAQKRSQEQRIRLGYPELCHTRLDCFSLNLKKEKTSLFWLIFYFFNVAVFLGGGGR